MRRYIKWTLIKHLPASRWRNKLPPSNSYGNYFHVIILAAEAARHESDDISDWSAIRNVHPVCISDSEFFFYSFIYLLYASSISNWCVSLQFIRAIGGLISFRQHLHLAMFLFLFFLFFLDFYGAAMCQNAPLSPSTSLPIPATITQPRIFGEMRREREVGRHWTGLARGGTGTVPPAWPPPDVLPLSSSALWSLSNSTVQD